MKLKKLDVVEALKTITAPGAAENLIDSKAVTNIMVFGDQIDIDVLLSNPSYKPEKIRGHYFGSSAPKGSF